jgi:hypothetical protein
VSKELKRTETKLSFKDIQVSHVIIDGKIRVVISDQDKTFVLGLDTQDAIYLHDELASLLDKVGAFD